MLVREYFDSIYCSTRIVVENTVKRYRNTITSLDKFCRRDSEVQDLNFESVNRYLQHEASRGLSPHTVRSHRNQICSIWREAASSGHAAPYRRPLMVRTPLIIVRCIPPDMVSKMVAVARTMKGKLVRTKIPNNVYWPAFIATCYETGLRTSDVLQLRFDDGGRWCLMQVKTRRPVTTSVSNDTRDFLKQLHAINEDLFLVDRAREWWCRRVVKIAEMAGLEATPHKLRLSGASEVERLAPNTAWVFLGHSGPQTTLRYYIDRSHAYSDLPRPRIQWGDDPKGPTQ